MSAEEAFIALLKKEPTYLTLLGFLVPIVLLGLIGLVLYFIVKGLKGSNCEKQKTVQKKK